MEHTDNRTIQTNEGDQDRTLGRASGRQPAVPFACRGRPAQRDRTRATRRPHAVVIATLGLGILSLASGCSTQAPCLQYVTRDVQATAYTRGYGSYTTTRKVRVCTEREQLRNEIASNSP